MTQATSAQYVLKLDQLGCELEDRVLFQGIDVAYQSGDLVQVLGPNGAGKTTLLRIITGLSSQYEGRLFWNEYAVPSYEFYSSLLYVGHAPGVKASMTPLENLAWYFGLNGIKAHSIATSESVQQRQIIPSRDDLISALEKVGLSGYEDVPSFQMSAGQQRRVALARLHVSKAPLWVLDEPFTAIDKAGVEALEMLIDQHRNKGGLVILTTHQSMAYAEPKLLDLAEYAGAGH